jgi:hypothetical protein
MLQDADGIHPGKIFPARKGLEINLFRAIILPHHMWEVMHLLNILTLYIFIVFQTLSLILTFRTPVRTGCEA